jgi:HTH-type transcriptional regulator/antitoxin HigA
MAAIKNEKQYETVMERIDELLKTVNNQTQETDKDFIELDLLSDLAVEYEKVHYPVKKPDLIEVM